MKDFTLKTSLLSLSAAVLLTMSGCSGGGGSSADIGNAISKAYGGIGIDGILVGSTVCIDVNENSACDVNEPTDLDGTDAQGKFEIPETTLTGPLLLIGGTDIGTGLPFTGSLTAPAGSTVITPLTSAVQSLVKSGATPEEAEANVKAALGVPSDVNLTHFDPFDEVSRNAQAVLASQAHLQTIVHAASVAVASADANQSTENVMGNVFAQISASFDGATSGVNLTVADITAVTKAVANDLYKENKEALVSVKNNAEATAQSAVDAAESTQADIKNGTPAEAEAKLNKGITLVNTSIAADINSSTAASVTAAEGLTPAELQAIVDAQAAQEEVEAKIAAAAKEARLAAEAAAKAAADYAAAQAAADLKAQKAAYDALLEAQAEELRQAETERAARAAAAAAAASAAVKEAKLAANQAAAEAAAKAELAAAQAQAEAEAAEAAARIKAAKAAAQAAQDAADLAAAQAAVVNIERNAAVNIMKTQAKSLVASAFGYLVQAQGYKDGIELIRSLDANYTADTNISDSLSEAQNAISNIESYANDANASAHDLYNFAAGANVTDANNTLNLVIGSEANAQAQAQSAATALESVRARVLELRSLAAAQQAAAAALLEKNRVIALVQAALDRANNNNVSGNLADINSSIALALLDLNAIQAIAREYASLGIDTTTAQAAYNRALVAQTEAQDAADDLNASLTIINAELVKANDANTTETLAIAEALKAVEAAGVVTARLTEIGTIRTTLEAALTAASDAKQTHLNGLVVDKLVDGMQFHNVKVKDKGTFKARRITLSSGTILEHDYNAASQIFEAHVSDEEDLVLVAGVWAEEVDGMSYNLDAATGLVTFRDGTEIKLARVVDLPNAQIDAELNSMIPGDINVAFSGDAKAYFIAVKRVESYKVWYRPSFYNGNFTKLESLLSSNNWHIGGEKTQAGYIPITFNEVPTTLTATSSDDLMFGTEVIGSWSVVTLPNTTDLAVIYTVNEDKKYLLDDGEANLLALLDLADDTKDGVYIGEYTPAATDFVVEEHPSFNDTAFVEIARVVAENEAANVSPLVALLANKTLWTTYYEQNNTLESWTYNSDVSVATWTEVVGGYGCNGSGTVVLSNTGAVYTPTSDSCGLDNTNPINIEFLNIATATNDGYLAKTMNSNASNKLYFARADAEADFIDNNSSLAQLVAGKTLWSQVNGKAGTLRKETFNADATQLQWKEVVNPGESLCDGTLSVVFESNATITVTIVSENCSKPAAPGTSFNMPIAKGASSDYILVSGHKLYFNEQDARDDFLGGATSNNAPVAQNDIYVTMNVNSKISGQITASDDDNDTLTFTPTVNGSFGAGTELNTSTGMFNVVAPDVSGQVSITVLVSDGNGGSDSVSLYVNVIDVVNSNDSNKGAYSKRDKTIMTQAEFTAYDVSANAIPGDAALHAFWGINDGKLEHNTLEFNTTAPFELHISNNEDNKEVIFHNNNLVSGEANMSVGGSAYDVANQEVVFKLLDVETDITTLSSELNISMPADSVAYKTAISFLNEEYRFRKEAKDHTQNPATTYGSLDNFIGKYKKATSSRTNHARVLAFDTNASRSNGSGNLVELDVSGLYNGAGEVFLINPNAGSWSITTNANVNGGSADILVVTPDNTDKFRSRIYVLDDFGIDGAATNTVWKGELREAGAVNVEYYYNDTAAQAIFKHNTQ